MHRIKQITPRFFPDILHLLFFKSIEGNTKGSAIKILISLVFLTCATISCKKEETGIIGKNEKFKITSKIIQDEYEIIVYMPSNYNLETKNNQLIIGLDGDFRFEEISAIISEKSQKGTIPPCIFIGVGNSKNRNRDYTPTEFEYGKGGAEKFYQFLSDELIPELEARYFIDSANSKTLVGNSFGGLFTQYAMFRERETNPFDKFISVGCSYWYDSGVIFQYEQQYANNNKDLPVKFFNAMGTLEGGISLGSFEEMNERLKTRAYPGFKSEAAQIKQHGHKGSTTYGFKKGLDYVFN